MVRLMNETMEKINLVKNALNIQIASWVMPRETGVKWEDFVCNIYEHIPGNKEQELQNLLQNENLLMNEELLEENVRIPEYIEYVLKCNKHNYPSVSEPNLDTFIKINRVYRKYNKKNLNQKDWYYYHDKILKGVRMYTLEKIWAVEHPIQEWMPVFITDKQVDLEMLGLCERLIRPTFFYNFLLPSKNNSVVNQWLQDHFGTIHQTDTILSYKRWEECIHMYSEWEKCTYAILIHGNATLHASHFYYAMHVLRMRKDISYLTIKTKQYKGPNYLISDTHPERFSEVQEVTSAFYGMCIVKVENIRTPWSDQSFYHFCEQIKGKKVVLSL